MTEQTAPGHGWLPPDQYVTTIANATFFGCLFFTDTRGRPMQMRSVLDPDRWDWPGGNTEKGETPWETAVRECFEETGIRFAGEPRLLATSFAPVGGGWPLCHIGFTFDGGNLTDDQIDAIVLDPTEHSDLSVRSLDEWRAAMDPGEYVLLAATDAARRSGVAAYLQHEPVQRHRPDGTPIGGNL